MHTQIDTLIYPRRVLREGEPCSHKGCLSHLSHPCEGCGRIGGRSVVKKSPVYIPSKAVIEVLRKAALLLESSPLQIEESIRTAADIKDLLSRAETDREIKIPCPKCDCRITITI
jgi:hypothetical protein